MNKFPVQLMLLVLILVWAAGPAAADTDQQARVAELSVHGEALIKVPADQMRLSVSVVTEAGRAEPALEKNSEKMEQVERALLKSGLVEEEYQTGHFSIQPKWSARPRNAPAGWKHTIVGYSVRNSFLVTTRKLELAGQIIEACTQAGANDIDSLSFGLADPRIYRAKAIKQATDNAVADAEALAAAAAVRLVRVLSVRLDNAVAIPRRIEMSQFEEAGPARAAGLVPPVKAGKLTVQAGVNVVYEIGPVVR